MFLTGVSVYTITKVKDSSLFFLCLFIVSFFNKYSLKCKS